MRKADMKRGNRFIDETGRRYGRLLVKHIEVERKGMAPLWLCECDCGGAILTEGTKLRIGDTSSCGCLRKETAAAEGRKRRSHGMRNTLEYATWARMKSRCGNESHWDYVNYGGRGIRVCEAWCNDFMAFYRDMGKRPSDKHSIDRIDVDGDYCPKNCRWATAQEQNNNRRTSRYITFDGRTQTLADWAREIEISPQTLMQRLRNWPIERALTEPLNTRAVA